MGASFAIRQYGVSSFVTVRIRQKESLAGRRVTLLAPIDDALILNDLPECIAARVRRQIGRFLAGSMQSAFAGSRQGDADCGGCQKNFA
jgi:hypothetical protein